MSNLITVVKETPKYPVVVIFIVVYVSLLAQMGVSPSEMDVLPLEKRVLGNQLLSFFIENGGLLTSVGSSYGLVLNIIFNFVNQIFELLSFIFVLPGNKGSSTVFLFIFLSHFLLALGYFSFANIKTKGYNQSQEFNQGGVPFFFYIYFSVFFILFFFLVFPIFLKFFSFNFFFFYSMNSLFFFCFMYLYNYIFIVYVASNTVNKIALKITN